VRQFSIKRVGLGIGVALVCLWAVRMCHCLGQPAMFGGYRLVDDVDGSIDICCPGPSGGVGGDVVRVARIGRRFIIAERNTGRTMVHAGFVEYAVIDVPVGQVKTALDPQGVTALTGVAFESIFFQRVPCR
jgi:hypothetical protein